MITPLLKNPLLSIYIISERVSCTFNFTIRFSLEISYIEKLFSTSLPPSPPGSRQIAKLKNKNKDKSPQAFSNSKNGSSSNPASGSSALFARGARGAVPRRAKCRVSPPTATRGKHRVRVCIHRCGCGESCLVFLGRKECGALGLFFEIRCLFF